MRLMSDGKPVVRTSISSEAAEIKLRKVVSQDEVKMQLEKLAGPTGPAGADGKTPIKGVDYFTEAEKIEIARQAAGMVEVPEGSSFETDKTLTFKDGILSVNTADKVEEDNTLPVTSAAVYTEVGNINALLATI